MKNKAAKMVIYGLCSALLIGGIGAGIYSTSSLANEEVSVVEQAEESSIEDTLKSFLTERDSSSMKDETVYVIAGADGAVQKVIVSDWLKNGEGKQSVEDVSELKDIENVKGDESYTLGAGNSCVWDADGNDIYYRGNIDKELPVAMKVSYTLNGKAISPAELAGKSGEVVIRYEFTNRQYEMVELNGETEKIYVPYAMLTGMILDNEKFRDVEISNGKLINDGSHTTVVGVALPGMQENLKLDAEKLEIPDYIEVKATTCDFELSNVVTIATNDVFSRFEEEKFDSLDELQESFGKLSEAMEQLMDGSSKLYDGMETLLDKSGELVAGIHKLADGATKLKAGSTKLKEGAADLSTGAGKVADGLMQISSNSDSLRGGAAQIAGSIFATANTQLAASGLGLPELTMDNYEAVLDGAMANLGGAEAQALATVTAQVEANHDAIVAGVTQAVRDNVTLAVTAAVREQVGSDEAMETEPVKAMITAQVDAQMATDEIIQTIETNVSAKKAELIAAGMQTDEVQAALGQAAGAVTTLTQLKASLAGVTTFYQGVLGYTHGVDTACGGSIQVSAGAGNLYGGILEFDKGLAELCDGIFTLDQSAPALVEGIGQLKEGAMSLNEGLVQFNEEGIQKLIDSVEGTGVELLDRMKASVQVSKNYKSFSGISDKMDGEVKFIYRTEAIQMEDNE